MFHAHFLASKMKRQYIRLAKDTSTFFNALKFIDFLLASQLRSQTFKKCGHIDQQAYNPSTNFVVIIITLTSPSTSLLFLFTQSL